MNDDAPATATLAAPPSPPPRSGFRWGGLIVVLMLVLAAVAAAAIVIAWQGHQRVRMLEQELVRRQQESQSEATEARLLAKQAQDSSRDAAAKAALLEARLAEVAVQRGQLEDLLQSLSRSRDENIIDDIEASLRVAQRQSLITGGAEPLVAALKQADERLERYNQPRLEGVRRGIAHDLERVRSAGVADLASLTIKLDEASRQVDELPLMATAQPMSDGVAQPAAVQAAAAPASAPASASPLARWLGWPEGWSRFGERVWGEMRSLVRVTRIDHPEAVLIAPEQALFLRENLKLRLLNARLALLSRQFDAAQADLNVAQSMLERYFDKQSRRVMQVSETVSQVSSQARQVSLPRPDDTLAALHAVAAGR